MKKLIFILLLISTNAYADDFACWNTSNNRITAYYESIDGSNLTTNCRTANRNLFRSVPQKYILNDSGSFREMTAPEKSFYDAEIAAAETAAIRSSSKAMIDGFSSSPLYERALADIVRDEINLLRQWITDFKADVSAATNLTDLKTRVAANPDLPDRTLAQLKTAIKNRIDSGSVDS